MGRTIPSFRIALEMEKRNEALHNALDKSERKKFEDMFFGIPKLYISACSNCVQLGALHFTQFDVLTTLQQ